MKKHFALLCLLIFTLSACQKEELLLVTTTSVENSGLIEYLIPYFEADTGINVKVVAVGTGAALNYGRNGQADILLVHDTERELKFIDDGYGEKRVLLMYNDFILVGPESLEQNALEAALNTLANNHTFYSRGDASGTHAREQLLWAHFSIDIDKFNDRYKETGQSMESTLMMASIKQHYTLTDRGTFLAMKDNLDLVIAFENDSLLRNDYGLIKVHPIQHGRDDTYAEIFYDWMQSSSTKNLIRNFTKKGEPLFHPYE